jgi:hypothetical protein
VVEQRVRPWKKERKSWTENQYSPHYEKLKLSGSCLTGKLIKRIDNIFGLGIGRWDFKSLLTVLHLKVTKVACMFACL